MLVGWVFPFQRGGGQIKNEKEIRQSFENRCLPSKNRIFFLGQRDLSIPDAYSSRLLFFSFARNFLNTLWKKKLDMFAKTVGHNY